MENDELARLRQQKDIRRALLQSGPGPTQSGRGVGARHKLGLVGYLLALIALGVLYYLLRYDVLVFRYSELLQRFILGAMAAVVVLEAGRLAQVFLIGRIEDDATQYNLRRVLRLLTGLILALIALSVLFANWYTAVVSLGLITLILGFALQTPITSFIGWIYILVRVPYRIGDRIRLHEATGDVIDVGYMDTTLWEYGGQYVSPGHPSGRLIKFPNSQVLSSVIYNYSWALFPFVWNEVAVMVAYQSDLKFVAQVMSDAARLEVGEGTTERVVLMRELLVATHVTEAEISEHPAVVFRAAENSWIEASVRYLVLPRNAAEVKSRMLQRIVAELNKSPDRAMIPQGNTR